MNILFLTMNTFTGIEMHNIYSELMKEFIENGHRPYIVTPREKSLNEHTRLYDCGDYSILKVRIGNTSNVSVIEKGISTVTLNGQYRRAIKKHLSGVEFGLILYSTPPITLASSIKCLKRDYQCPTYLMLKDIFPQNAVDLEMMNRNGVLHRYFRKLEIMLYQVSDMIGCMSQGNVDYVIQNNPYLDSEKVEVCPNAISPKEKPDREKASSVLREKYHIPDDSVVYMYGGNLGKPQGIPFLIEVLSKLHNNSCAYFFICGSGTEYELLECYLAKKHPSNVVLNRELPKDEYDALLSGCDVGLLFLDHRFTIPNYPSRMLSYMEQAIPVAAFTDRTSDVRKTIAEGEFGWWCPSDDSDKAAELLIGLQEKRLMIREYGDNARMYLEEHFQVSIPYNKIARAAGMDEI